MNGHPRVWTKVNLSGRYMSLWLLIMDPSSIRFSKVLEKRCRYSVCRGTQPRAEYFIHTNYRVCSWHLYHVNNSTLWHNDATPAEKIGRPSWQKFPHLGKAENWRIEIFFHSALQNWNSIVIVLCLIHLIGICLYCFVALELVDTYIFLSLINFENIYIHI